ncbi:hypothetical protein F2Q68_00003109 [Brassica cretica]|uniref:Dihydroorotate dehydrogenase catalytic domain-containing protein n=1 Tax=Brassica cretica TaxID=69181 RepID=A0A8S9J768_BRACR|nr:hypothetical protein F2Q68_00003109 [Brassica cretica]
MLKEFKQLKQEYPDRILIASIMEEYSKTGWEELLTALSKLDALEINFSCPHGMPERRMDAAVGQDCALLEEDCGWVNAKATVPVWAKMTPNITDITEPARVSLKSGCEGISAINTIMSVMGIDLKMLHPEPCVEGRLLLYTAVRPIALAKVMNIAQMMKDEFNENDCSLSGIGDRGEFDPNVAGGVARSKAKCIALPNGDIVVSLQVYIVDCPKEPIIEILQFEKHQDDKDTDSYGNLLKWLIPLDNTISQQPRSLPPPVSSTPGGISSSNAHKTSLSSGSGSQLFSFGHFRSYSMSALPAPNTAQVTGPVKTQSSKPSFDLEDWDSYSGQTLRKSGTEELLSFRGVPLERDRFSVRCGLEGICIPGRRWRRKLEIIQPIDINSFAADCNTDDLLCVQIKNVAPTHTPDIVIYIDAITIVFEEAGKSASPSSVPIACIEAGNEHSLPNLTLRKGEEHSFIVKPAFSVGSNLKPSAARKELKSSSLSLPSVNFERLGSGLSGDHYAVMVSCRCNYTESRLFFKQRTKWRPRVSRDLMISVASEMSGEPCGPHGRASQLPVQILTLQASNLTSEDLSLTVLAPASFTSPPSVVSLNSTPTSPISPFLGFSEFTERVQTEKRNTTTRKVQSLPSIPLETRTENTNDEMNPSSDVVPKSGLGCTHLWLQSRVPLGCVPSKSTATIKLELLPLTDGIITLDTLQIHVKEKGRRYIPEQSLKINATSSISSGIF